MQLSDVHAILGRSPGQQHVLLAALLGWFVTCLLFILNVKQMIDFRLKI